ncbi:MAG: polyphosphate polymerase domain-containing protein [Bacteroidaceae bacterium]|nr:polyphosphate polymerase domain-containing protein [Bacteroidaceae bacterium]
MMALSISNRIMAQLEPMVPISLEQMESVRLMNRTDSKFIANTTQLASLLGMTSQDYLVQEIGNERIASYRTLYLDDSELTMYTQHHCGHEPRQKVRIRSYVDSNLDYFEVKIKNNHGRTKKKRIQLTDASTWRNDLTDAFLARNAILPIRLSEMEPRLSNSFKRITMVNTGRTERLTIDTDLCFHNEGTGVDRHMDNLAVIEVKRDSNTPSPIMDMLRELRIFSSGFSKYCIGMALTEPGIRRGNFKERLVRIEKLTKL